MCTLSLSCESCVCNVHCVQFAICTVCGSQLSISPIPLTPFQLFSGQSTRCNQSLCRKNDFCSKSHHAKMLYLCLVLAMACLESLRRDSNTFHNQLYCQKHIKQNNGLRKYPDRQRGISSTTDLTLPEPCIRNPVEVAERQHCLFGGLSAPGQDLLHLGSLVNG